jgi:ATP-binding cassette subfamily B protein
VLDSSAILDDVPLLKFLPPEVRSLVIGSLLPVSFSFGSTIVQEGEPADAFYILTAGRARVLKRGEQGEEIPLAVLKAGESFGEMALLEQTTRVATVRASGDVEALRLDRSVFNALVRSHPEIREYFELQITHRHLHNFFRQYTAFVALPPASLAVMLRELQPLTVHAGDVVIRQGEAAGPMYVVEEGRLRVFVADGSGERNVAFLRKGDFFGEVSIFKGTPRTATVQAVTSCKLLVLRSETFESLLASHAEFRREVETRVSQYDYKQTARVPLDFAQELLPADVRVHEKVGPGQIGAAEPLSDSSGPALGPFASAEGNFVKKDKKIRRFPYVRQIDAMDCGAASLAMVCRHFGRAVSLARIRQLVHTASDGTSLRGICSAAAELGLAARSVKASPSNVLQMPLPAIVHWDGNHWVVLYGIDEAYARVADPAQGLRKIRRQVFDEKWSGYAALFDYTKAFDNAPIGRANAAWLWPFLRPYGGIFAKAFGLAVVVSGLEMLLPILTQVVVDRVLVEQDAQLLNILVLSMMAVLAFTVVAMIVQRYLLSFAAVRIDAGTLDFLTRRLLALPMSYFNTRRTGDIQRRLQGMRQIREFIVQKAMTALSASVQLAAAFVLMLLYSPLLAGVFLLTVPLYALMMRFSSRRLKPMFDDMEEAFGRYQSYQIDAIKGIETVKAMAAELSFRELMLAQFHRVATRLFKSDFTMMLYDGTIHSVTFLTTVMFLWVGAYQVMRGQMTIGALVAFNALVALANAPIVSLLTLWDNMQLASVLLNRLNDVFEQEPEQGFDHTHLLPVRTLEGRIGVRNLGFRYGGPESPAILDGISFDVPAGRMVAIVGRSGSGKTTFIKCLAGLLEPTSGTILYDGVDMKTLNYRDLRRHIGFVLQENHLFDDTIARNIAFGEEEPDMDRVIWAARAASADEFIERLPLGYDTKIGESGIAISGGQRQRIAIARAVYLRPPVLIFDEATSALDTESERAVKENLDTVLQGRTSFVIAHRLSTVRDADLIVVLEKGRLVEQGTHDELIKRQGLYFYLASQQLGI